MCKQLYEWGIDLMPYVPLMITPDEFKQITGKDYAAGANA